MRTDAIQFAGVGRIQGNKRVVIITKKRTKSRVYIGYCFSEVRASISKVLQNLVAISTGSVIILGQP